MEFFFEELWNQFGWASLTSQEMYSSLTLLISLLS